MKKLFLTSIICFLTTSAFGAEMAPKWPDTQNWKKLKKWMSPLQVANVLGNPLYKDFNAQAGIWYFQDAPQIEGTKITRPDYGLVRFRRVAAGGYVVLDWKEPDWDKLAQLQAEKERQKELEGPTPEELEAARIEAERIEREKQIAEEARQAELERQRALRKQQEAEKFNWLEKKNLTIGGGILLAIIAIYLVCSKAYS